MDYLLVALAIVIVIALIGLAILIQQEHERLLDPYIASFVREKPGTWRWHIERFRLRLTGGIPRRS